MKAIQAKIETEQQTLSATSASYMSLVNSAKPDLGALPEAESGDPVPAAVAGFINTLGVNLTEEQRQQLQTMLKRPPNDLVEETKRRKTDTFATSIAGLITITILSFWHFQAQARALRRVWRAMASPSQSLLEDLRRQYLWPTTAVFRDLLWGRVLYYLRADLSRYCFFQDPFRSHSGSMQTTMRTDSEGALSEGSCIFDLCRQDLMQSCQRYRETVNPHHGQQVLADLRRMQNLIHKHLSLPGDTKWPMANVFIISQVLTSTLRNPDGYNFCFGNAPFRCWCWAGAFADNASLAWGRKHGAVRQFLSSSDPQWLPTLMNMEIVWADFEQG